MNIVERINIYVNRFYDKIIEAHKNESEDPDGADWIDEVLFEYGLNNMYPGTIFVSVVEVERVYGGPEEGGWWYDVSIPLETIKIDLRWRTAAPEPHAFVLGHDQESLLLDIESIWNKRYYIGSAQKRFSVNGSPDYHIDFDFVRQKAEPDRAPRYE